MTRQPKSLITILLIASVTACALIIFAHFARAERQVVELGRAQDSDKRIVRKNDFDPPVKITLVKTNNAETSDVDWLNKLEISARNDSGKIVTYLGIELTFPRDEGQAQGPPGTWSLHYGIDPFWFESAESMPVSNVSPIKPHGTRTITVSESEYKAIKRFLIDLSLSNIKLVEVRIIKIGFSDGSAWNVGNTYRRLPQNFRWRNEKDGMEVDTNPRKKSATDHRERRDLFFVTSLAGRQP